MNLTENVGYFLVERDDIFAPEHPTVSDLLEIGKHLREDGAAVVFELVVQTAESGVDGFLRDLLDWAGVFLFFMRDAGPIPHLI